MGNIAKNIFEKHQNEFLEGHAKLEELVASYGIEGGNADIHAYVLILNQNSPEYESKLDSLETDHGMTSAGYTSTQAGFIKGEGEASRIGLFGSQAKEWGSEIGTSQQKMEKFLGNVLFDIYQLK